MTKEYGKSVDKVRLLDKFSDFLIKSEHNVISAQTQAVTLETLFKSKIDSVSSTSINSCLYKQVK